jgi:hypothetical protein
MKPDLPSSRRSLLWCVVALVAAGVAGALLVSPFIPHKVQLRITAFAVTKEDIQSLPLVRPSEWKKSVLWQRTVQLVPSRAVVVVHETGAHRFQFEFTPVPTRAGRVSGHALGTVESFGALVHANRLVSGRSYGAGTWGWSASWEIPLAVMTSAEAAGRKREQTETIYGFEALE